MVDWLFLPQNFGLEVGPTKIICCSGNVHGVAVLFAGGGDTYPLYVVIKLFVLTGGGEPKTLSKITFATLATLATPVIQE